MTTREKEATYVEAKRLIAALPNGPCVDTRAVMIACKAMRFADEIAENELRIEVVYSDANGGSLSFYAVGRMAV